MQLLIRTLIMSFTLLPPPPSPSPCRYAVQEVLSRHCNEDEELSPSEGFVINQLKVPAEWVYEAKVSLSIYGVNVVFLALLLLSSSSHHPSPYLSLSSILFLLPPSH